MKMNLSPKYIVTFILMAFAMIGWNVFLIQRDNTLFDNASTMKERYCAAQVKFTPDCNVE